MTIVMVVCLSTCLNGCSAHYKLIFRDLHTQTRSIYLFLLCELAWTAFNATERHCARVNKMWDMHETGCIYWIAGQSCKLQKVVIWSTQDGFLLANCEWNVSIFASDPISWSCEWNRCQTIALLLFFWDTAMKYARTSEFLLVCR